MVTVESPGWMAGMLASRYHELIGSKKRRPWAVVGVSVLQLSSWVSLVASFVGGEAVERFPGLAFLSCVWVGTTSGNIIRKS